MGGFCLSLTSAMPPQGALQQLCARLERQFRCRQRRGARLCGAQLDSLATLLFFRWHKMLA